MRMEEIKPSHLVTEEKVQEMIDDAIRKHNRNASIISFWVGWIVLSLFAEGLLRTRWSHKTSLPLVKHSLITP